MPPKEEHSGKRRKQYSRKSGSVSSATGPKSPSSRGTPDGNFSDMTNNSRDEHRNNGSRGGEPEVFGSGRIRGGGYRGRGRGNQLASRNPEGVAWDRSFQDYRGSRRGGRQNSGARRQYGDKGYQQQRGPQRGDYNQDYEHESWNHGAQYGDYNYDSGPVQYYDRPHSYTRENQVWHGGRGIKSFHSASQQQYHATASLTNKIPAEVYAPPEPPLSLSAEHSVRGSVSFGDSPRTPTVGPDLAYPEPFSPRSPQASSAPACPSRKVSSFVDQSGSVVVETAMKSPALENFYGAKSTSSISFHPSGRMDYDASRRLSTGRTAVMPDTQMQQHHGEMLPAMTFGVPHETASLFSEAYRPVGDISADPAVYLYKENCPNDTKKLLNDDVSPPADQIYPHFPQFVPECQQNDGMKHDPRQVLYSIASLETMTSSSGLQHSRRESAQSTTPDANASRRHSHDLSAGVEGQPMPQSLLVPTSGGNYAAVGEFGYQYQPHVPEECQVDESWYGMSRCLFACYFALRGMMANDSTGMAGADPQAQQWRKSTMGFLDGQVAELMRTADAERFAKTATRDGRSVNDFIQREDYIRKFTSTVIEDYSQSKAPMLDMAKVTAWVVPDSCLQVVSNEGAEWMYNEGN